MSPIPLLLKFKANLRLILKFRSKRKPEEPPPSPIVPKESLDDDEQHWLNEKEYTFDTTAVDTTIWRRILTYCEVIDIIHLGMTCRLLANAAEDYIVWYCALLRITHEKRLPHLDFRIKSLSCTSLRQKAILAAQLDVLSRDSRFRPFPHATTRVSLQVTNVWSICFLPGGEWLVLLCRFKDNHEGVLVCKTNDPWNQPVTYDPVPTEHWWTRMRVFTSDRGDSLLLLRSDRLHVTRFRVYQVHLSGQSPSLEMVWADQAPAIDGCAVQGNCIAYGWVDRRDGNTRHFVRVLQLTQSYRDVAAHFTMEVECQICRWPHSYGLRLSDSEITVVTANTELIAAYKVPPLVDPRSSREPIHVRPFWRFPCTHMKPRSVYLVPSLPAVNTPSVIISYQNRQLFLTPGFDADPPDLHPSYFLTYTSPRGLKRPLILGPHRAFWDLGCGRVGTRTLPSPLHPAFCEGDNSNWDMSGINAPEADLADEVRPLTYAKAYDGRVMLAAWDEESGKLAILPEGDLHKRAEGSMDVFIVSLIH